MEFFTIDFCSNHLDLFRKFNGSYSIYAQIILFFHILLLLSRRGGSDGDRLTVPQYVYRRQPEFSYNNCVSDFVIFNSIAIHHLFQIRNDKLMRNW